MVENLHLSFAAPYDPSAIDSWGGGALHFICKAISEHSTVVNNISTEEKKISCLE